MSEKQEMHTYCKCRTDGCNNSIRWSKQVDGMCNGCTADLIETLKKENEEYKESLHLLTCSKAEWEQAFSSADPARAIEKLASKDRFADAMNLLRGIQDDDAVGVIALEPSRLEELETFLTKYEKKVRDG